MPSLPRRQVINPLAIVLCEVLDGLKSGVKRSRHQGYGNKSLSPTIRSLVDKWQQ